MTELLKKLCKFSLLLLLSACTVNSPMIKDQKWEITLSEDMEKDIKYESLSLFLYIFDEDGENDIETIFLINDDNGLVWEFTEENWDIEYNGDEKWYGATNIYMQNYGDIPRNSYRIHVRDLAGEFTEQKLYITQPKTLKDSTIFPDFDLTMELFTLENFSEGKLVVEEGGITILEGDITNTPTLLKDILGKDLKEFSNDAEYYLEVKERDLKLRSGPILID